MNGKWFPDSEAHLVLTLKDGRVWNFPTVRMESISYGEPDPYWRRIGFEFVPLEEWTVSEPTPETKQEKRRRLIKEMYPQ